MARVIDLKKKIQEPSPVIEHPVVKKQEIITDSGEKLPYQTLHWIAPNSYRPQDTRIPHIFAGLLIVAGVLVGIFQHDVILTVLLVLMGVMVVVFRRQPISQVNVEVSPLAVKVGSKGYAYDQIKSFWLHYEPQYDIRELSLQLKQWYAPYVKIQIGDQDPVQMRAILIQFIPEVEHQETLVHTLVRKLGL